jgi:hypothetical protein
MNPFMTTFFFLGLMYAAIGVWSFVMGFTASMGIGIAGVLFCYLGWRFSRDNL